MLEEKVVPLCWWRIFYEHECKYLLPFMFRVFQVLAAPRPLHPLPPFSNKIAELNNKAQEDILYIHDI